MSGVGQKADGTEAVVTGEALVPDLLVVEVPLGARVLVLSDVHLEKDATFASTWVSQQVGRLLDGWTGPGVVVFAGDTVELLATNLNTPERAMAAHPRLVSAVARFRDAPGRRVVCLVGNHDGRLAWDAAASRSLAHLLGAELALAAELVVETGAGTRQVRVEHGHQLDPANRFVDQRDPNDTPLGHHVVRDLVPNVPVEPWLEGLQGLSEVGTFPAFIASRLVYRRVATHLLWLFLPLVLVLALKLPLLYALLEHVAGAPLVADWTGRLAVVAVVALIDVAVVGGVLLAAAHRAWLSASTPLLGERGTALNDPAREMAARLVEEGYAGLVTGHTHHPELALVGDGFYLNAGCCTPVVEEWRAWFGLPSVFLSHSQLSYVEIEAGARLYARLHQARLDLPGGTRFERLVARRPALRDRGPEVVTSYPEGPSWPARPDLTARTRRIRRVAAGAIALAGLVDIASAFTPPVVGRLRLLLEDIPLAVPQAAAALVALSGLALLLLARGVRRGQRRAWAISVVLLSASVVLNLVKGVDLEEALAAAVVAAYVLHHRSQFRATAEPAALVRGLASAVAGAAVAVIAGTVATQVGGARIPVGRAVAAVSERLVGLSAIALPDRPLDDFLTPCLFAIGVGLAMFSGWVLFRPVVSRHGASELARARDVVRQHGRDTLAYFALRDDKRHFFSADSVVAYAVWGGVCLVSPDPVGPVALRAQVWSDFRQFCDRQGWSVAVLGASEDWLAIYRAAGMQCLYVGDEAVVDCRRFSLEGGRNKGLRQAVNRVARNGYRVEFHDPATLDRELRASLGRVMVRSRRGDVERGFSMTLGRVFDPDDTGLLIAVCYGPSGEPVAFCQYVPAPGIDGYSLDLMRRDQGDHPNGVVDFLVVETIRELQARGMTGLGLNFATFRAVVAGDTGHGLGQQLQRWFLRQMSDSMQIESLWRFTAKYDPDWQPRYAVYDGVEHVIGAALAVARAESFWELPVIGRFLVRAPDEVEPEPVATP